MEYLSSYKYSSLAVYNVNALWELYLVYRQYKCLSRTTSVPLPLESHITMDQFKKAKSYSLDRMKVHVASTVLDCITMSLGTVFNTLPRMWYKTTQIGRWKLEEGSVLHCVAFTMLNDLIDTVVELPLSLYSTFRVEQRHGFNNQTLGMYFLDKFKMKLVTHAVSLPMYYGVNKIINRFGPKFPMYLGTFFSATAVVFSFLYPNVIQPMFNKFTPLEDGPLKNKIIDLATKLQFPLTKIFVVDNSVRNNHSNAYLYGFFKNKRIVLYDTLVKSMAHNDQFVLAVLAHELGHWKMKHNVIQLVLGVSQMFGICYGASRIVYNPEVYKSFGFHTTPRIIGLMLFFLVVMTPVDTFLSMAITALVRQMEFQADRYAVDQGYGDDLKSALLVLREHNSASVVFDDVYAACKCTHPPLLQRLAAIDKYMLERKGKE
eukprot:PhF_6_TR30697/c0_g1_i1/m.45167/K06013/STE24; STE24 endopeptidase